MNILVLNDFLLKGGGAETHILDLKSGLESRGHSCEVINAHPSTKFHTATNHPDFIHFHNFNTIVGLKALSWAQENKIPHLVSLHDYWGICPGRMMFTHGSDCAICDASCGYKPDQSTIDLLSHSPLVTFNPSTAKRYETRGLHPSIIPHGIDTSYFKYIPSAKPALDPKTPLTLMFAAAWTADWKGRAYFEQAVEPIRDQFNVISIEGTFSRDQMRDSYQRSHVFVCSSLYQETFALVVAEALACGTPVVSFNVAGPSHIITPSCGRIVPYKDVRAMTEAILYCAKNYKRMGKNGSRRTHSLYSLNRMINDYERLYAEIISESLFGDRSHAPERSSI